MQYMNQVTWVIKDITSGNQWSESQYSMKVFHKSSTYKKTSSPIDLRNRLLTQMSQADLF